MTMIAKRAWTARSAMSIMSSMFVCRVLGCEAKEMGYVDLGLL